MIETLFKSIIHTPFDWMEVWATFFPIAMWLWVKKNKQKVQPTIWYFFIAFFVFIIIDVIWKLNDFLPEIIRDNNIFYNILSILRVIFFVIFFLRILEDQFRKILVFSSLIYPVVIVGCFIVFHKNLSFFNYNSVTTTSESVILMMACILYLFQLLQSDVVIKFGRQPEFWISSGLIIFEAANFTINLTYSLLVDQKVSTEIATYWNRGDYVVFYDSYNKVLKDFEELNDFAIQIWVIPNLAYLTFCLFVTKAYYELQRK
jgi:hypothetical protein